MPKISFNSLAVGQVTGLATSAKLTQLDSFVLKTAEEDGEHRLLEVLLKLEDTLFNKTLEPGCVLKANEAARCCSPRAGKSA